MSPIDDYEFRIREMEAEMLGKMGTRSLLDLVNQARKLESVRAVLEILEEDHALPPTTLALIREAL